MACLNIFELGCVQAIVADKEGNVRHVLRVIPAHHLGENQIECGWTEQPQPPSRWPRDRRNVPFPVAPQEDLICREQMRDVQPFRA